MKMKTVYTLLLTILIFSTTASAVQTIKWDRSVIPIQLIVGVERMVTFEGPAQVGLPPALLSTNIFRQLFVTDTAYWKALQPFNNQRIKVRLENTGQYLLFDVSAKTVRQPTASASEPLNIIVASTSSTTAQGMAQIQSPTTPLAPQPQEKATLFEVLRYAVQNDYSPARVITAVPGVTQIDMQGLQELRRHYRHPDHRFLSLIPMQSWRGAGWYVTSIKVTNTGTTDITVDPSRMQQSTVNTSNGVKNNFIATAMVVRQISPRANTHLYVVTDKPFFSVIGQ
ncbi:MAG: DUF3438 family protein [Gammaproteobacteria bacterium]